KAGENIKNAPLHRGCIANAVGGDDWQFVGTRNFHDGLITLLLFIVEVTLKLDVDVVAPIDGEQSIDNGPALFQAISERSLLTPGEANESLCEFFQIGSRRP